MITVNPYLNFNGQTEEAFTFYQTIFGGNLEIVRFHELENTMNANDEELKRVANASLLMTGKIKLFGSDILESMGHRLESGNNFYINLETDSEEETARLFHRLSDGGVIEMSLQSTGWAKNFGMLKDRFGIQWMVYQSQ